jgi:hypothetical protein
MNRPQSPRRNKARLLFWVREGEPLATCVYAIVNGEAYTPRSMNQLIASAVWSHRERMK